ncbi:MAG: hypothetical protein WCQ95_10080 [Bacteroidota bacterium]
MAKKDYIPASNLKFHIWQSTLVTGINKYKATWALSSAADLEWIRLTETPGKKKCSGIAIGP